jgi:hypothetical protein
MIVPKKLFLDTLMPGGVFAFLSLFQAGKHTAGSISITKAIPKLLSILLVGQLEVADAIDTM